MNGDLLPSVWVIQWDSMFADAENTGDLLELCNHKLGDYWCTQPNLTNFGLTRLHHMGMYGIILH